MPEQNETSFDDDDKLQELIAQILNTRDTLAQWQAIDELEAYAFQRYCRKPYLPRCEPQYCAYRATDTCPYFRLLAYLYEKSGIVPIRHQVHRTNE